MALNIDHPVIHVLLWAVLWVGAAAAGFHTLYWSAAWYQVARMMRELPTGRRLAERVRLGAHGRNADSSGPIAEPADRVCVIVPAHNEEAQIQTIARSLLEQTHPELSVVFVLDRCTDRTLGRLLEVVADHPRVTILQITHCPDGWAGKPHAMWRGVNDTDAARNAEFIAFIDADTQTDPRCIAAMLAVMRERRLDLVSLLSTLSRGEWFERVAQPPATFELMRQYPIRKANAHRDPSGRLARRPFANGQFIMVRRPVYLDLGGHESVREHILEDVELSRRFARNGRRTGLFIADGLIRCRMYNTFDEFQSGWNRIYRESVHRDPKRLRSYARRLRVMSVYLPAVVAVAAGIGAAVVIGGHGDDVGRGLAWWNLLVGVGGLVVWFGLLAFAYRLGQTGARWSVTYPYGSWLVARILDAAASDVEAGVPIRWGGRTYHFPAAARA